MVVSYLRTAKDTEGTAQQLGEMRLDIKYTVSVLGHECKSHFEDVNCDPHTSPFDRPGFGELVEWMEETGGCQIVVGDVEDVGPDINALTYIEQSLTNKLGWHVDIIPMSRLNLYWEEQEVEA